MVDPEQRVVVVHNKRQLFSGLAEHDAAVALETFERTRDPKRTFTARIDLPLSP
jgi:hypothetical protein